jgi:hypothetical protein
MLDDCPNSKILRIAKVQTTAHRPKFKPLSLPRRFANALPGKTRAELFGPASPAARD